MTMPAPRSSAKPADTQSSAANLQHQLQDDEALIEYVVGPDRLTTFVVTARAASPPAPRRLRLADLNARIALLRDLVQRPGDDRWLKPAASLSADAADAARGERPAARDPPPLHRAARGAELPAVRAAARSIGAGPARLLIDRYALAYLPAAAALRRERQTARSAAGSLLAMAPARSRLRYAPEEARSIDALFEPHSRLLIGAGATESQFKKLAGDFACCTSPPTVCSTRPIRCCPGSNSRPTPTTTACCRCTRCSACACTPISSR